MNYRVCQVVFAALYIFGCIALGIGTGTMSMHLMGNDANFFTHVGLMLLLVPGPGICMGIGHIRVQEMIEAHFEEEVNQEEVV